MKTRVITVYVTMLLTIISLAIAIVFSIIPCDYKEIIKNIGFAVFGSSLVALIISLVEYFTTKRITLEDFFLEYVSFINKVAVLPYLLLTPDEIAYSKYLTNENMFWKFDAQSKREFLLAMKIDFEKKNTWLKNLSYEETEEYFSKNAQNFDKKLRKILESYISFSRISLDNLGRVYGSIFYMFRNKSKVQSIYDSLYSPALVLKRTISKEAAHFANYIEGDGQNTYVMVDKLDDLLNIFFEKVVKGNKTTVYAKKYNELSDELEKFRCKIYGSKYQKIKHDPIYFSIKN